MSILIGKGAITYLIIRSYMKSKEELFQQFRKSAQYKNTSDADLMRICTNRVMAQDPDLDAAGMFTSADDKKLAKYLMGRYLEDFTIENIAEKNTLKQLVFLEVIQINSLQSKINEFRKANGIVPQQALDGIHKNIKEIKDLKNQLGIKKNDSDKSDAWVAWESLQRKVAKWRSENQASRTLICPHCGKMTMLRIRMESWEALKHPMFKDRILYNKHAMDLMVQGKLSRMDVAKILDEDASSTDYVDWLVEKIYPKNN